MSIERDPAPAGGQPPVGGGVPGRWVILVATIVIASIAWFIIWGVTR